MTLCVGAQACPLDYQPTNQAKIKIKNTLQNTLKFRLLESFRMQFSAIIFLKTI
jgi:hypothetical protein